jgi:hypothetical protein
MSATLKSVDRNLRENYRLLTSLSSGEHNVAPALYTPTADVPMRAKWAMSTALGQTPQAVISIDQQDLDALEDKAFAMKQFQFDDWIGKTFGPTSNPAMMDYLHRIYPEYEERQVKAVETWHNFQSRLQQIQIRGPQSADDLYVIYKLGMWNKESGDTMLMDRWDIHKVPGIGPRPEGRTSQVEAQEYMRGVFNRPYAANMNVVRAAYDAKGANAFNV